MKSSLFLIFLISSAWCFSARQGEVGQIKSKPGERIIGGNSAEETEFPFMAAIWKSTTIGRYFCGGSVLSRQWILTAGHCVENAVSFYIQLGSISLSGTSISRVNTTATNFVLHPDFNTTTLVNNIGLIQLSENLVFNDYVNIINLPTEALDEPTVLTTIGWGQINDENSGPVDRLQKVLIVSYLQDHCESIYGIQITDTMVCAMGSYNQGTCIGDMGGPLIQFENDTSTVVGIASFLSFNGCESLEPSGFERTFSHLEWIKNVTGIA